MELLAPAMLLLLLAAAAPGKERAALQADLDSLATTLDTMLDHERRADPIAWIDNMAQVGDGQGEYTPRDATLGYPKFNNDAEAAEYFTAEGVFTEDSNGINPSWTKMDIVFSFGAANGGFANVVSLADTLLETHQLNSYIDSKYLPNEDGSYLIPDTNQDNGNSFPRNVNWKAWYKRAMLDAPTMIFIVTEAWLASPFCAEELGWAISSRMAKGYLNIIVAEPKFLEKNHNTPVKAALLGKLTDLFFTIQDANGQSIPNPTSIEFHVVPYAGTTDDKLTEIVNGIGYQIADGNSPVEYMRSIPGYVQVTSSASGSSLAITFTGIDASTKKEWTNTKAIV